MKTDEYWMKWLEAEKLRVVQMTKGLGDMTAVERAYVRAIQADALETAALVADPPLPSDVMARMAYQGPNPSPEIARAIRARARKLTG